MMFGDEEASDADGSAPDPTADRSRREVIVHPRHEAKSYPPPVAPPPAYRHVIAGWSLDWRERWGRRANELEDEGLSWRDAEAQAFVEVWKTARHEQHNVVLAPSEADPERN
jgi:hypothetical protein